MQSYGQGGNGALSATAGVNGQVRGASYMVGSSAGRAGNSSGTTAASGQTPGAGGGAGHTADYTTKYIPDPENPGGYLEVFDTYKAYTSGGAGGKGRLSIVVTRAIFNRAAWS